MILFQIFEAKTHFQIKTYYLPVFLGMVEHDIFFFLLLFASLSDLGPLFNVIYSEILCLGAFY